MSVHRLLSKRHPGEKHHFIGRRHANESDKSISTVPSHPIDPSSPADFYGLFDAKEKPADHNEEQKVQSLQKRVMDSKAVMVKDTQVIWALRSRFSRGNENKAFALLLAISNASEGLLEDYSSEIKMLGAENRQGATCYLDAILFAMFSRLASFEAMLYNSCDDVARNKLAFLLRLWVNLLRTGHLITSDITKFIQESLAECGWQEAATLCQQDASEAFTFITGQLDLPLLTLKMDIYHTGREDADDDHKFINERLLEVAIPPELASENQPVTLEACLEEYFNNRIEVRRYLERRSTINSIRSVDLSKKGSSAIHVETVEVGSDSSPTTPLSSSPSAWAARPSVRHRAPSIIQERFIPDRLESGYSTSTKGDSSGRLRSGSIRKEVMMPAWQFFSLIPWYTDHTPSSDVQVANHFSAKRPVLGLCLKRYSTTPKGIPKRLDTQVDIPVEIGLPHFIQDDHMEDDGPLYGNFKLSLQSVVCHRGNSVNSGHYICLSRCTTVRESPLTNSKDDSLHWMRFDDLASQRITLIDIEKALKEETPYLLFYQIVPIEGDPGHILEGEQPPVYSTSGTDSSLTSLALRPSRDEQFHPPRLSSEISRTDGVNKGEARRGSITFSEPFGGSVPGGVLTTESNTSRPSTRGDSPTGRESHSLSRTPSKASDGGLSKTFSFSRLTGMKGKEVPATEVVGASEVHVRETSNSVSTMDDPRAVLIHTKAGQQKPQRHEKSRSRLSKHGPGKGKERPDRECVVM